MYEWKNKIKDICRRYWYIGIVIIALLVGLAIGYGLGLRNSRTDVSNNGSGIADIRNELGTAQEHQREITSGLKDAVGRSDRIEERSNRIEKAAAESASAVNDAGKLIDECQQIIGRVRNRGKADPPKN